jgi:phenylpropionate dioxygenase-like ring-hydroxylating dioxygenase large terminal subunit
MTDDGIFLRNSWYVAAWNHELIDGIKLARTILERPIVLYRGASGKVVALDDRCCHRAAPLSMGRIEGDDIRCMYHGMKFDPGGKCIQIPGQDVIPPKLGVRSYPTVERYNLIWIWPGDAEKADPELIVDYPPLADPKWRASCSTPCSRRRAKARRRASRSRARGSIATPSS